MSNEGLDYRAVLSPLYVTQDLIVKQNLFDHIKNMGKTFFFFVAQIPANLAV